MGEDFETVVAYEYSPIACCIATRYVSALGDMPEISNRTILLQNFVILYIITFFSFGTLSVNWGDIEQITSRMI